MRPLLLTLLALPLAAAEVAVVRNPTTRAYEDELVRVAPGPVGATLRRDGEPAPVQTEAIDGTTWLWTCGSFAPGSVATYEVGPVGAGAEATRRVKLAREGGDWLIDNGVVAVKVPAEGGPDVGPISGLRLGDGRWVGASAWATAAKPTAFTATVVGDGTLFALVRLRWTFPGTAGLAGDVPAFAEVDVRLGPGWRHVELAERHELPRGDRWELDLHAGWKPVQGFSRPYSGGLFGDTAKAPPADRPLLPGGQPFQAPELYISLVPRWNQQSRDGWLFAAGDGGQAVGAVAVRAGSWLWPHDNMIDAVVREAGDQATLRLPAWHGRRTWWLMAGAQPTVAGLEKEYITRRAFEPLDKLNRDYDLDWPGQKGSFRGEFFYDGAINPTGGMRTRGKAALKDLAKPGDYALWTNTQVLFHPDMFGDYWRFWSPQNPNFFTDFMRVPIAQAARLKAHPRFADLARRVEATLRQDLHHSVTLPGGAGQECPGYLAHALATWRSMAPLCKEHFGFDPTTWERFTAAESFLRRTSQPDGGMRRMLPMGDTHPGPQGPKPVEVPAAEVAQLTSEELPGFGCILRNRPGTPRETYLAFKSGPNRGHYHGDQLALHWAANARPLAVDHHCSYKPRAGQEHLHNRVAFATADLPWANLDGYERLIAFAPGPEVDIAVGQVESPRLRATTEKPPENWDQRWPARTLASPLVYRRSVVLVKNGAQDYLVLRDQFRCGEPVSAIWCLHVLADRIAADGARIGFGDALTVFRAHPAQATFASFPWEHANGGGESTQGARLSVTGDSGEFITVLWPNGEPPAFTAIPGGVRVGDDEIAFTGGLDATDGTISVTRGGKRIGGLAADAIDPDRSQGDVGLFVPDVGYPFGPIPDWLMRQRQARPDWAK